MLGCINLLPFPLVCLWHWTSIPQIHTILPIKLFSDISDSILSTEDTDQKKRGLSNVDDAILLLLKFLCHCFKSNGLFGWAYNK